MNITLDISDTAAAALNGLTAAIHALAAATTSQYDFDDRIPLQSVQGVVAETAKEAAESGPVYWADNETGFFGKVDDEAAYASKKKRVPAIYKIPAAVYTEKALALREKNDAAVAKAKPAAKPAKPAKTAAKSPVVEKPAAQATSVDSVPSVEDLVAAFSAYLPKDLEKEERADRYAFVKPMLQRFGAAKASEILPEHRELAIELVRRKMAGEDIDPTAANFDQFDSDEGDESLV